VALAARMVTCPFFTHDERVPAVLDLQTADDPRTRDEPGEFAELDRLPALTGSYDGDPRRRRSLGLASTSSCRAQNQASIRRTTVGDDPALQEAGLVHAAPVNLRGEEPGYLRRSSRVALISVSLAMSTNGFCQPFRGRLGINPLRLDKVRGRP
jgi:hypothetical protein